MSEPITSVVIAKWIAYSIWSVFGGLVHTLTEHRKGRIRSWKDGMVLTIISTFTGSLWTLLALHVYPNDTAMVILAGGLGGFLSLNGLAMVLTYFKNKFGIK